MRAGVNKYWTHMLSLFIISLALIIPASAATLSGNDTDQLALLAFKAKISNDPLGVFGSWNTSLHFCLWEGIICNKRHQRVISLNLSSNGLAGSLSPDIGNMSFLSEIILYNNSLQGTIPQQVDQLFRLKVLRLERNALEGKIPDNLGRANSLVIVDISLNKLSGMIPTSIFNLSFLNVFNLASNQLQGSIPSDIGLTLPNLQKIQLAYNKFTGSIPVSLSNASKLQVIDFQSNNLSGPISVDFGRLPYLQILRLSNNNLGFGEQSHLNFLDPLTNCSSLQILELGSNNFQRSLPRSFANLSKELTIISLADNQISGSIPFEIGNYVNLISLSLEGNKFTGIIPSEIVKLGKLQRVLLSNNRLSGNIPASIGNLSLLYQVHLEDNELNGTIPSSFGNCPKLVLLDLSQNNLSGTIPDKFFYLSPFSVRLNLSRNHLSGALPADIGALGTIVELDISENEFSGLIPGNLGGCITLNSLYIQGNLFQGHIPQSLGNLKGMQHFDFSRNNLSKTIPDFFKTLPLEYLNLSWNSLEGEVPTEGVFANASAYSIVGNKGLCGGIPELQLPRCSSNRSHTHKMTRLQILILIDSILVLLAIGCSCIFWLRRKIKELRSKSNRPISVTLITLSYKQLHQATNGFSQNNLVSKDAAGTVYKGKLGPQYNKTAVAIKVFKEEAANCFITECEALRNIHHRNIVKIISTCSTIVEKHSFTAIVYDVMEHRSLDRWLHSTSLTSHDKLNIPQILNLSTRINIAIDVASALDYLHNLPDNPLIHCNLTPSNIWLDTDMCAHVSNFGLAEHLTDTGSDSETQIISGGVRTPGYIPPELRSITSTKRDVYGYGLILLEMLTGKKTTDPMFNEGYKLQNFVTNALSDRVKDIIDPVNLHELTRDDAAHAEDCLSMLFNIGVKCTLEMPQFRPDISDTLSMLKTIKIIFQVNTGSTTKAYAHTSSLASDMMDQGNTRPLPLTTKMAPSSRLMSTLSSVAVSYVDLHKASNGFSLTNLIGAGGFGSVYKGRFLLGNSEIEDGTGIAVAIKVFNLQRRGAVKSFKTEYKTLENIHHPNLVKIITTCTSVDEEGCAFRAILYEFMDNGSLEMWLHPRYKTHHNGPIQPHILSLQTRIDIAIDVANALSYLHHQCKHSIIHCDLKPGNILLDINMVAYIADFGLAISLPKSPELNRWSSSTGMRGTLGYIPPEYGMGCKMTTKGDTYSFGILLLETLTRKKPTHRMFRGGLNLHNFVWMAMPNNVMDITDPLMMVMASANEGDENDKRVEECLTRIFNIGLACSETSPKDRPDMRSVLHELESIRNSF